MSSIANEVRELIDRHQVWLKRVIAAHTATPALMDDVFSEVLLAVAKCSNPPTTDRDLKPWLCKIAIRQAALANRTAMRRARLTEQYSHSMSENAVETDPIIWLMDQERNDAVRQAIREMDPEMRQLLIDKYVHQRTYAELAAESGVAAHVAEYRVARAKKQLRIMMTERGLGEDDIK